MNSSPTITKISAALVKAQAEMGNAIKSADNPFFKKKYADLNSVREAILPILSKHGMVAIQPTAVIEGINYVETIILHESGEYISGLTQIITDKPNDAQRHGSGLSYARRYGLASICNIGADDDDANHAAGKTDVKPNIEEPKQEPQTPTKKTVSKSALEKACKRIKEGEKELYQKMLDEFQLEPTQKKDLLEAFAEPFKQQLNQ